MTLAAVRRGAAVLAATVALGLHPVRADEAAAVQAFDEGKRLMAEGKVAEACERYAASYREDPQYGALYNLADCHNIVGRVASAWAEFREAERIAREHGDGQREQLAHARAALLEPRLVRIVVRPPARPIEGLALHLGDQDVTAWLDVATPIDFGIYTLIADAPGLARWTRYIVAKTEGERIEIVIPPWLGSDEPDAVVDDRRRRRRHHLALVTGGVGLAVIGVGLYYGHEAFTAWDESRAYCDARNVCPTAQGRSLVADAQSAAWKSNLLVGAGVGALVGSAVLWLTAPDAEPRDGATRAVTGWSPAIGHGTIGAVMSGQF